MGRRPQGSREHGESRRRRARDPQRRSPSRLRLRVNSPKGELKRQVPAEHERLEPKHRRRGVVEERLPAHKTVRRVGVQRSRHVPPEVTIGRERKAVVSVRKASIKWTPQSTVCDWSVVRAGGKLIRPLRCISNCSAERRLLRIFVCLERRAPKAPGRSGL